MQRKHFIFLVALLALLTLLIANACDTSTDADDDDDDDDNDDEDNEVKVLSVQPSSGPIEGGTQVAVLGRNFTDNAAVTFGGKPGTDFEYISDTEVRCATPAGDQAGPVTVRVTNPDESYGELVDGFRYGAEPVDIGWCGLHYPDEYATYEYFPSGDIYGRVYVEGCTEGAAQCDGIAAQLGYGPTGVDPSLNPDQFTWIDAQYNEGWPGGEKEGEDNDEYMAMIPAQTTTGDYAYAYRVTGDSGESYTYCDKGEGSSDGFSTDQMGILHVLTELQVGWCGIITGSETSTTTVNVESDPIYGQIWIEGITGRTVNSPWVSAQIGVGPTSGEGGDPSSNPDQYDWFAADWNDQSLAPENNSEYMKGLTRDTAGTYGYAYRFSANNENSWTYCDTGAGSDDGFQPANMGVLTVNP